MSTTDPMAPPKNTSTFRLIAVGFLAATALVAGLLTVAALSIGPSRTDGMTCDELKQDNLTMTDTMTREYDLDRVRENNAAITELGCA